MHWLAFLLYAAVTAAALACTALLMPGGKQADAVSRDALSLLEIAMLVGGRRHAAEVVVAWMLEEGAASLNPAEKNIVVDGSCLEPLHAALGISAPRIEGCVSRIDLLDEIVRGLTSTHDVLVERGLIRTFGAASLGSLVSRLPFALTSALGFYLVSRFGNPPQADAPLADVGVAVIFCASGMGFVVAGVDCEMTSIGMATRRVLRKIGRDGPLPRSLHGHVAFLGPDQMRGTPFAAYLTYPSVHSGPA